MRIVILNLALAAMVALVSCASAGELSKADKGMRCCGLSPTSIDCRHIKLKSVVGIDDEVLKNTNRFPLAATKRGYVINLDQPLYGFTQACVFLNGRERENELRNMPHQLRSVIFKKEIAPDLNFEKEYKAICAAIADFLKVKMPKVKLAENMCRSSVVFMLNKNQSISVAASNPRYVLRDGKMVLSTNAMVDIGVTYNLKLTWDEVDKFKCEKVPVEQELDFGFDCSEALSKAMKSRIKKTVRRKDVKGKNVGEKTDKKGVGK